MTADKATAPYVPFRSFLTALEVLRRAVPSQIDRSVWPTMSGAAQSQMLIAFRFLGLIDENNITQPELQRLVVEDSRPSVLAELLKSRYRELFAIGLEKASPAQLDAAMEKYNVQGSTREKAVSFFIQAAQFADIALSPHLTRKRQTASTTRASNRPRHARNTPRGVADHPNDLATGSQPQNTRADGIQSRTIKLRSGGELTLSVSVDVFDLSEEDHTFVFGLIRQLRKYEQNNNDERPETATQ